MTIRYALTTMVAGCAVLVGSLASGMAVTSAQDEAASSDSMPAFIMAGDCSNFDANPVGTLTSAEMYGAPDQDDDEATREVVGTLTASPVLTSESDDVEVSFDDMIGSSHAVTVHMSQDDVQTVVACGDIGGSIVDDELVIALHEVDGSGFNGIVEISKEGDDKVDVTLYVAGPAESQPEGTPAA